MGLVLTAMFVVACGKSSPAGKYSIDVVSPAAREALPGAENIILELTEDGKVTLAAGPMLLLDATWKQEGDKVTFSQKQGMIGTDYKFVDGNLVPIEGGKAVEAWKFTKK